MRSYCTIKGKQINFEEVGIEIKVRKQVATVQPFSNLMLVSTGLQVNSIFLMRSTETHMFDIFTHMSMITHTHVFKVLKSLLTCTQVGIANTL